ncbi:MAG: amino acid ABC transporter permease, partial [Cyanobacteria bacterium M_surface_7_m2_040]|nr:amino acid ABC transporter permease [Cyanobacteria bacterium M_surface_7_m2_040]
MTADVAIAPTAPQAQQLSPLARLRRECFATPVDGLITLGLLAGLGAAVQALLHWALRQA